MYKKINLDYSSITLFRRYTSIKPKPPIKESFVKKVLIPSLGG